MKKLFSGMVFDLLALPNGIVFSYCQGTDDDKTTVGYKMISFETGAMTNVAKNIYLLTKFGSNYKRLSAGCENYISARVLLLQNNNTFISEDNGSARLLDVDGEPIWEGEILYHGSAPSDVMMYKSFMWACYRDSDVLLRFNLATMREELRIGGTKSPFSKPVRLFPRGDGVIVSNAGSNQLLTLNLNSYAVSEFDLFAESPAEYLEVGEYKFVVLESGLYLID